MEAGLDRDDARVGRLRRIDAASAHADQFTAAWLFVCGDLRRWLDLWNVTDVRLDRLALCVQLEKADSPSSGFANSRRRLQHLLRHLVRLQSSYLVNPVNPVNLVILFYHCLRCRAFLPAH